jgi:hypothetical protein
VNQVQAFAWLFCTWTFLVRNLQTGVSPKFRRIPALDGFQEKSSNFLNPTLYQYSEYTLPNKFFFQKKYFENFPALFTFVQNSPAVL